MSFDFIPRADELPTPDLTKPVKGSKQLAHREKTATEKAHEQREMQAALKRDERKCRVPRCEHASRKLTIDPAHQRHRGMGGNAKGDRTTRATVISLCRIHHGDYDRGDLNIEPLTPAVFDSVCAFYVKAINGKLECIGVERLIGVPVERGV